MHSRLTPPASPRANAILRTGGASTMGACVVALAVAVLAQLGCGGSPAAPTGADRQVRAAMTVLSQQYGAYATEHNGTPPKDEAAFRGYLQSRLEDLSIYNVKSPDDLLVKGRDGQPLQIVYGAKMSIADRPEYIWAAYEQTGVGGKRLASDSRGGVYELDAAEFNKQLPGK